MPKLKKFSKKNKLSTKNILISFAIIIGLLTIGYISKSYAIYKLQQDYDVIKNKIGTYSMGDVRVAVLVDGKETDTFPTYETNYKVESVECTNGVTASFDVENWQINIADMSATSTKCTVSFNSKETNEITPVNMSKTELLALNDSLTDDFKSSLKKELLNETYPVGSIFMSTTISETDDVAAIFGGKWERYATDRTLVGYKDGTNEINEENGAKTVELEPENLPYHTHKTEPKSINNWTAALNGDHKHGVGVLIDSEYTAGNLNFSTYNATKTYRIGWSDSQSIYGRVNAGFTQTTGGHEHTVSGTIPEMTTTECTNCSAKEINVQDPYIVVYMYKRTA